MTEGTALSNKELVELSKAMVEFQAVLVEANAAVVKLLKGPVNADLTTPEGSAAWFSLVVGVSNISDDDVLGVALAGLLALVRLHHQPELKVTDIFPGLVAGAPA